MNKIELIQSLIDSLTALPHRDEAALHAFRARASMIIRNTHEGKSGYGAALANIDFRPISYYSPLSESDYDRAWNLGKKKTANLLEVMKEEVERFEEENSKGVKSEKQKQELKISMKEAREQFLIKLNEMSGGDIDRFIETMSIGEALGFDAATTFICASYFDEKKYIIRRDEALGAISITAGGIDEVDKIQSRMVSPPSDEGNLPEEKYFPPGSQLDIQRYMARVLRQAKVSLWICDGYMDEKIVEEILYVGADMTPIFRTT